MGSDGTQDENARDVARVPTKRLVAVWVLVLYGGTFVAWVLLGGGSERFRTVVSDLAFLPVGPAAAVLAWVASRRQELPSRTRRGWRLIALAMLAWGIADTLWCFFEVFLDEAPFPSVADAFYLAFYPLLLRGVALVMPGLVTRKAQVRLVIDALTITAGAALAVWIVAIAPTLGDARPFLEYALNLAYPVGDVLIAFAIAVLLLRRPPAATAAALRVLMIGAVAFVAADLSYAQASLTGSYSGGDLPDALWMIALVLFAVAAHVQVVKAPDGGDVSPPVSSTRISVLPYVAAAAGFALLLAEARDARSRLVAAAIATFVITASVSVRQLLALLDNERLAVDLEEALERSRTALEEVVAEQARAKRFLADAAHQLRTPIAGLQSCSETLLRGVEPETHEQLVHTVGREAARAGRIVNDLVTIARLDRDPRLQPVPTDVWQLCEEEAARLRARAPGLDVAVRRVDDAAPGPPPMLDGTAVREIVSNLLDNAGRHAEGRVDLSVHRSAEIVHVEVRDDGPGLADDRSEAAFDRFVTLDGHGGGGLGLAVAQGYARIHGGELTYADGAFQLTLPADAGRPLLRKG